MPKDLLVNASPFFAAALNGNFAEATSRSTHLPEDNTDAFAIFIRWLYVAEISCDNFHYRAETSGDQVLVVLSDLSNDSRVYATQVYLQACILGDKLGCIVFMDHVTLELIKYNEYEDMKPETMLLIYGYFGLGSQLRRFVIDQFRRDFLCGRLRGRIASFIFATRSHEDIGLELLEATLETNRADAVDPRENRTIHASPDGYEGRLMQQRRASLPS